MSLPAGTVFVEFLFPRTLIGSFERLEGDPLVQDGLNLHLTGFGGTVSFFNVSSELLGVTEEGLASFSLHVPLEGQPDRARTEGGFAGLVEEQVNLRIFIRRDLRVSRPYDLLSFTHEYGSFEVALGPNI